MCRQVDLSELQLQGLLGTGASGSVFSVLHGPSGQRAALKLVSAACKAMNGEVGRARRVAEPTKTATIV